MLQIENGTCASFIARYIRFGADRDLEMWSSGVDGDEIESWMTTAGVDSGTVRNATDSFGIWELYSTLTHRYISVINIPFRPLQTSKRGVQLLLGCVDV